MLPPPNVRVEAMYPLDRARPNRSAVPGSPLSTSGCVKSNLAKLIRVRGVTKIAVVLR